MKHTKLVVIALLVALMACLSINAMAECDHVIDTTKPSVTVLEAGCITEGSIQYYCAKCGAIFYKAIPSLGGHVHSGIFVEANAGHPTCVGAEMYEKCARFDKCGHYFTDTHYTKAPETDHEWEEKDSGNPAGCTTGGISPTKVCKLCGAVTGGKPTAALGHAPAINYTSEHWAAKRATCASEGKAVQLCTRCGAVLDTKVLPKLTYHVDAAMNPITEDDFVCVWPTKAATCTVDGSYGKWVCPTCGKADSRPARNGARIPATGHRMEIKSQKLPTCTTAGETILQCVNCPDLGNGPVPCGHYQVVTAPAIGHSATWYPTYAAPDGSYVQYELKCGKCGLVLASQIVAKGEKAPSTTTVVNTAKQAADQSYKASTGKLDEVAKNGTTTKKTTKTTTKTATAKAAPAPAAPAPAAPEAAAIEGAVELKDGIIVINDAVAVLVKEGKVTLLNAAAEDETVAFYAAADAEPVALVVGEAIDMVEGACVAIVKTADLPAATASK
jgi:hypothetical protein